MDNSNRSLLRRLRLKHLELLGYLSEVGTVAAAAKLMHLSQPAVTRMIKEIEDIFGGPLFDRTARGISANHIGEALTRRSGILVAELAAAQEEAAAMRSGASGLLRIGSFSGSVTLLSGLVELLRRMPDVAIQIQETRIDLLITELLRGELDCVVGALAPDELNNERLDHLRVDLLAGDRFSVIATKSNPFSRYPEVSWEQLSKQQWILPARGSLLRRAVIAACLAEGIAPPRPSIECDSTLTLLTLLRLAPLCIGPVREQHALEEIKINKNLVTLNVSPRLPMPPIAMITRRSSVPMHQPVSLLLQILQALSPPYQDSIYSGIAD